VGSLPREMKDPELKTLFSQFGTVKEISVPRQQGGNANKGEAGDLCLVAFVSSRSSSECKICRTLFKHTHCGCGLQQTIGERDPLRDFVFDLCRLRFCKDVSQG
jgi:RNA recognition motif-containing protein